MFGVFVAIRLVFLRSSFGVFAQFVWCFCAVRYSVWAAAAAQVQDRTSIPSTGRMRFRKRQSKEAKTKTLNVITLRLQHGQGFARVRDGICSCKGVDWQHSVKC